MKTLSTNNILSVTGSVMTVKHYVNFLMLSKKIMYGCKVMGIEWSTFLINNKEILRYAWRKVKVPGHVEAILTKIKNLHSE